MTDNAQQKDIFDVPEMPLEEPIKLDIIPEPIIEKSKPKRKRKEKAIISDEVTVDEITADDTIILTEVDDLKKKNQYMMKQNDQQLILPKKS